MTRIQDDLFATVNAEWLEQAQIPTDKPRISAFDELVLENEKNLTADLQHMSVELPEDNPELLEAIKFYNKAGYERCGAPFFGLHWSWAYFT